jgi:hypothetical protein
LINQAGDLRPVSLADAPYLVALALVEKDGRRSLPITGKSQTAAAAAAADPGEDGRTLALELLLRLWQGSDDAPVRRAAGETSLLLIEIPMEVMSEQLPILKANWLAGGDSSRFEASLQSLIIRAWRISLAKYEPLRFIPWP